MFKSLFRPKPKARRPLSTDGRVVYAVGDVHGRLDLLDGLIARMTEDFQSLGRQDPPVLVMLGDYVDRGAQSAAVIDRLIALKGQADEGRFEFRALMGNHEETLLHFLDDPMAGPSWVEYGGGETLASYGVQRPVGRAEPEAWEEARLAFRAAFPPAHEAFLRKLELAVAYGDYVFVHAGVRPGLPLEQQTAKDLLWIRNDFLDNPHGLQATVVHGHTPVETVFVGRQRINVDTGAYATGVLTAVRLDGGEPKIIQFSKARAA
ncbi:metallophosphoesterase family protein [uncultured Caulobacter sp.]|uniref:metallophosphoesterase family protein n=1 Tax=uncultured Caulobacter sp. TaxID=158749 RepID=UPI00261C1396|nr:metallophosphoesterase family protein [uncultured Caulobacter sp.]